MAREIPRSEFLYVNVAKYKGHFVCKVGRSNNPRKRLFEFNNGLRHRLRRGHIDREVVFSEFFIIRVASRSVAKSCEKKVLGILKDRLLIGFGREVFMVNPDEAAKALNEVVSGVAC